MLEDVPTNVQLVLRILRRLEHQLNPLPFDPTEGDTSLPDPKHVEPQDSRSEEDQNTSTHQGLLRRVMKLGKKFGKAQNAARSAARRALNHLQEDKEQVSVPRS